MPLSPIPEILDELRKGRIIVLVDDENRENEGDFVCAASKITPELVSFMIRVGGGYLCVALTEESCDRLELVPQSSANTSLYGTALTVAVDGHPRHGVGTGVSARDRVRTIQLLVDSRTKADDFVRPGHINPLRRRNGGVLVRTGQTEGSVDLARLAGLDPSAVLIEVVRPDGEMARMADLAVICREHDLKMCSIEQIIEYRLERETLIERIAPREGSPISTPWGTFNLIAYQSVLDPLPHLALTLGDVGHIGPDGRVIEVDEPILVRMHRRDLLGDVFEELSHPTARDLRASLAAIQEEGRGVLVYLRPEGVGEALRDRLLRICRPRAEDVNVPDLTRRDGIGSRIQPHDKRDFGIGGQILRDLGLRKLRILTNHPKTLPGLHGFGLEIVEQTPIPVIPAANETGSRSEQMALRSCEVVSAPRHRDLSATQG